MNSIQKPLERNKKEFNNQLPKNLDNRKMKEKIQPQEQKEKFPHRKSSRLQNQPRKDYITFIPQSKILKKVEFQKPL